MQPTELRPSRRSPSQVPAMHHAGVQRCARRCAKAKDPAARVLHMRLISDSNSPCASGSAWLEDLRMLHHPEFLTAWPANLPLRISSKTACSNRRDAAHKRGAVHVFQSRPASAHRSDSGLPAPGQRCQPPVMLALAVMCPVLSLSMSRQGSASFSWHPKMNIVSWPGVRQTCQRIQGDG